MIKNKVLDTPTANRLLAALPFGEYRNLLPKLEQVPLIYGENIYQQGENIRYVYFPTSGIISLVVALENSSSLEVGLIGKEGIVGLSVFLGVENSGNRAVVQGAGYAMRMKTEDFLAECEKGKTLPRLLKRFTHSLLTQASQSAVCCCFHSIDTRLARWILMTSDRMEANEFHLTQEFLSHMLGVRREGVNKSAVILQQQQLISYSRGNMSIINRPELETKACLCYGAIKAEELIFPPR
jgi:CRP-like cAMP-binding protein